LIISELYKRSRYSLHSSCMKAMRIQNLAVQQRFTAKK
jgi:hypothetical protein